MVRAIDANALWADIMMLPHVGDIISSEEVEKAISEAPTLSHGDMAPRGEWEEFNILHDEIVYECSVCARMIFVPKGTRAEKWAPYCHCGAKME